MTCDIDYQQVAYDAVSDGCWPLITNDRDMTGAEVLAAYRYQPNLERRHHLLKGVQDAAPIWIKTIPRIEAIFLCHFIALLIGALIERQIRMAMKAAGIARIPVYPELRGCAAPSADRIFDLGSRRSGWSCRRSCLASCMAMGGDDHRRDRSRCSLRVVGLGRCPAAAG